MAKRKGLHSYQIVIDWVAEQEPDVFNFPLAATYDEAYTQYAALTDTAEKSKKAKRIVLKDLVTTKVLEETNYVT